MLYQTVVEQIRTMRAHKLRGTFLLQYDALAERGSFDGSKGKIKLRILPEGNGLVSNLAERE